MRDRGESRLRAGIFLQGRDKLVVAMQNVPKIVRQRLQIPRPVANHPDADVLAAFAERSLPDLERAVVLEHLAHCRDCREIVALALPAIEPVETAAARSDRSLLSWPVLRWAFVAVGIVSIASIGILQYQRRTPPLTVARKAFQRQEAANEAKNRAPAAAAPAEKHAKLLAAPPPAFTDSLDSSKIAAVESRQSLRAVTPPAPAAAPQSGQSIGGIVAGGGLQHGPRVTNQLNQWQQNANAIHGQAAAPVTPPAAGQQAVGTLAKKAQNPSSAETVEVQAQPLQIETEEVESAAPSPSADDISKLSKAKPLVTTESANAGPAQATAGTAAKPGLPSPGQDTSLNGRSFTQSVTLSPASPPSWTITSAGGLQRSFDQGKTWQDVDVNANPASGASPTSLAIVARSYRAKESVNKKDLNQPATSPIFRAVAATGADVWAGGSAGALYHSLDAGDHWTRVVPSSNGTVLTGDIVSLQFSDAQHGQLATADSSVWTTSDDGQSWQKQ